jgi:phosphatidylglycerophosphatase A
MRTAKDYLALAVASCGVGYSPIAPGTCGSIVGVGFYLLLSKTATQFVGTRDTKTFLPAGLMLLAIVLVTLAGVWAASRTERILQRKDPGLAVIDEVAGQMIALMSSALYVHTWWSIISAFVLFRLFDIWKPYPLRRLENMKSGWGVMMDDVGAGIYALAVNAILIYLFPLFQGGR